MRLRRIVEQTSGLLINFNRLTAGVVDHPDDASGLVACILGLDPPGLGLADLR